MLRQAEKSQVTTETVLNLHHTNIYLKSISAADVLHTHKLMRLAARSFFYMLEYSWLKMTKPVQFILEARVFYNYWKFISEYQFMN